MIIQEKLKLLTESLKEDLKVPEEVIYLLLNLNEDVRLIESKSILIQALIDMIIKTKSSIIIYTPFAIPEILQTASEFAYQRKSARFLLTCKWDMMAYGDIIKKMRMLGNIFFRNIDMPSKYYLCSRDASDWLLGISSESETITIQCSDENKSNVIAEIMSYFFEISKPMDVAFKVAAMKAKIEKKKIKDAKKKAKKERKKEKKMKKMYK